MTRATLAHLMTPALPPFYRLFMGGLVPSPERGDPQWLVDGVQSVVGLLQRSGVRQTRESAFLCGAWWAGCFLLLTAGCIWRRIHFAGINLAPCLIALPIESINQSINRSIE